MLFWIEREAEGQTDNGDFVRFYKIFPSKFPLQTKLSKKLITKFSYTLKVP